jgi:hypothetical protein
MGAVKSFYRKKMEQARRNEQEFGLYLWKKEHEENAKKIKNHFKKKGLK